MPTLQTQLTQFVSAHPHLAVLTGAGCSTPSGLGDYRDKSGQWKRRQPITGQVFLGDERARKRYWARSYVGWPAFNGAKPSRAHHALSQLQSYGVGRTLITQNVDELHQQAGHKNVIDLHGALSRVRCVACQFVLKREEFQQNLGDQNPWLAGLSADYAPDGDADLELDSLESLQVPPCPKCGGILKPDVVFFGETVPKPRVLRSMESIAEADALMVVGSSLMVYSGFRFCVQAQKLGKPIAIVNDGRTRADELASIKVDGECGQRLSLLIEQLTNTHVEHDS